MRFEEQAQTTKRIYNDTERTAVGKIYFINGVGWHLGNIKKHRQLTSEQLIEIAEELDRLNGE